MPQHPSHSHSGYAGDITPRQAVERVEKGAVLVDVRTVEEWQTVGVPDLSDAGTAPVFVEWNRAGGVRNESFLNELHEYKGRELLFICRSGVRSVAAAQSATSAGHTVYNVLYGFEANGGWRLSGLATTAHTSTEAGTPALGDADD
ncbi:rhodanese-like domain-containing protein [Arthrobacter sp. H5]|uniref:rhodanese-like domain-containing protein n=1 Tax=Arthrobacter sp. H5 TaxID=1267973 RepID=UPI0006841856|nr:rhodanese-like domain-containing protein [Arthrobacter sp. H5]